MLSKQEIANLALGHLGMSQQVLDYDVENTVYAKVIRRQFRSTLDTMLEKHQWGFATQFSALALESDDWSVAKAYKYVYSLPADCLVLRVIACDGYFPEVRQYEKEKEKFREFYQGSERAILTNVYNAHGEYTTRLSEDISFPTHFARGLSHLLALDIAPQLITNNFPKVKDSLITTSKNEISVAIAADLGREPQLEDSPTPFISCRMGQ